MSESLKLFDLPLAEEMANFQATHPATQKIQIGDVWMAPQFKSGTSIWAVWVREGELEPWNVVWAWRNIPEKKTRQWLAIRLDSGREKPVFIDLTHPSGTAKLKDLERKMAKFINDRLRHRKEIAAMNTLTEKEVWELFSDPSVNVRVEIEKKGWTLEALEPVTGAEVNKDGSYNWEDLIGCEILYGGGPDKVELDSKTKTVRVYYF